MHFSATPSVPSQLSSAKAGSMGSLWPFLVQAYSHPQVPVSGLPSTSHWFGGQPMAQFGASALPSPGGKEPSTGGLLSGEIMASCPLPPSLPELGPVLGPGPLPVSVEPSTESGTNPETP